MNEHIKINDLLNITIRRMGINGEGIGYFHKLAIFVEQALPEEELEIEVQEVYDNRAIAKIKKIIKKHPLRRDPFCPVYEACGGCQTQHLDYQESLVQKREILIKSFERYVKTKLDHNLIKETIGSKNPMHYRNKAALPVRKIDGKNQIGMYARGSNHFVEIDSCPIQNHLINHVLKSIIKLMDQFGVDAYDEKQKKGFVKNLIVRIVEPEDEIQVSFVLARPSNRLTSLVEDLVQKEPHVKSVFQVILSEGKKPAFFDGKIELIHGEETIKGRLHDFDFYLKPEAFFQLNVEQAHLFYLEMRRLAALKKHEIAIDAYAGIAPVSHYIAKEARHVYAVEMDKSACESAKLSLSANKIENVTVLQSSFKSALNSLKNKKVDVMFFDPPRLGLGEETIELIMKSRPSRLIYGSCNPSTLAKDLNKLLDHYDLIETVPIDMFPYTSHVECVVLMSRVEK